MQAEAAGVEPHVDMNPILLKPTSDVGSQVILNGRVLGNFSGADYYQQRSLLLDTVTTAYERLAARHEVIVLEGAGSPVEMNLKDRDVVNMKMAEIADAACLLVTDIDRGGVFASLVGTYELLEPQERNRFFGFLINKFRGDVSLFTPGISYLEERLAQTCLGVIPYLHGHGIDDEDSVSLERRAVRPRLIAKIVYVYAVVGLPYLSNFTDFTALEACPALSFTTRDGPTMRAPLTSLFCQAAEHDSRFALAQEERMGGSYRITCGERQAACGNLWWFQMLGAR